MFMISDGTTFDDLQSERRRRRRQALVDLRELEQTYRCAADRYCSAYRAFIQTLDEPSCAVVVHYEKVVNELLEAHDGLRSRLDSLTASSWGLRLKFEGRLMTPTAAAKVLVKRHDPAFLQSHPDCPEKALVRRAAGIVEKAIERVEQQLAELRGVHEKLVGAARLMLDRAHDAIRLGLASRDQTGLAELEALIDLLFPGTVPHSVRQEATRLVRSLLKEHRVRETVEIVGFGLGSIIEQAVGTTLPHAKREVLTTAAKQLSTELDRWCVEQVSLSGDSVAKAILGLSFSFASSRRGLGGLSATDMARSQDVLNTATPSMVRTAIESLIESGLLQPADADLFRYTPSVGRPFRECVYSAGT